MGEKEGQEIINELRRTKKEVGDAAGFVSGVALSEGEAYALQVPVVKGEKPDEGDIERYFQKCHHGTTLHDMFKDTLEVFKADISIENIELLKRVFLNFFEESWIEYQKDGKQYSAFFDSQGVYKEKEAENLFNQTMDRMNPLDSSDRPTAIRIKVSTREKLKKWGKSKGIEKSRGFDRIILDLLESKGINNLDPKMVNLSPREKEIVRLIQKGINTTEEMKDEFFGDAISLRSIQKEVNSLLRKDVIFQKRRGNLSEYFVKTPE